MSRLTVALLTRGDPAAVTGGHLYHRRLAALAPAHQARIAFFALPSGWPAAAVAARRALARAEAAADVLAVDSIATAAFAPFLGRRRSPRFAVIAHQSPGGIDGGPLRRAALRPLDIRVLRRAALVLAASRPLAAELAGVVSAGRVRLAAPGRDPAAVPGAAVAGADLRRGRRIAVLCVANWLPRKNHLALLDALAGLPADAATLHLAGDDRADPACRRRIRARLADPELAGRVVVHGLLDPPAVAALYAGADVFALPSAREPYGTVYGEALAAGLPVVGFRAGNLPELATDGQEALLAEPGDVAGLGAALRRLADDAGLRARLAAAARRRGRELPSWDDTAALVFGELRVLADPKR